MSWKRYERRGATWPVQSKRGCPLHCIYCSYPGIEGRALRKRDPREVAEEIARVMRDAHLGVHLRFRGGKTRTLRLPSPRPSWELHQTDAAIVQEGDEIGLAPAPAVHPHRGAVHDIQCPKVLQARESRGSAWTQHVTP